VTTGDSFGEDTAIVAGLKPGEKVVTDHIQDMRQDLKVETKTMKANSTGAQPVNGAASNQPG
jgi:hypothetical protein